MTLKFLPSLQHLAFVKVALIVYNDDFIHLFYKLQRIKSVEKLGYYFYTSAKQEKWASKRKKEARNKLHNLLPEYFIEIILNILQPLVDEFYFWVRDHWNMVQYLVRSHFTISLCWKSVGIIDRLKTATRLVRNQKIDKRLRLSMACIYFLGNDVLRLWEAMTANERRRFSSTEINISVTFCLKWLMESSTTPWVQYISEHLRIYYQEPVFGYYEPIKISSFFTELDIESKRLWVFRLWPNIAHFDDLRLCYGLAHEAQRAYIFQHNIGDVLCCYLDWPLQSLFLDTVNQVRDQLTDYAMLKVSSYIVEEKLLQNMQDSDYRQHLKDFWKYVPDDIVCPREFQWTGILTLIHSIINYDETNSLPFRELLHKCKTFLDELFVNWPSGRPRN